VLQVISNLTKDSGSRSTLPSKQHCVLLPGRFF